MKLVWLGAPICRGVPASADLGRILGPITLSGVRLSQPPTIDVCPTTPASKPSTCLQPLAWGVWVLWLVLTGEQPGMHRMPAAARPTSNRLALLPAGHAWHVRHAARPAIHLPLSPVWTHPAAALIILMWLADVSSADDRSQYAQGGERASMITAAGAGTVTWHALMHAQACTGASHCDAAACDRPCDWRRLAGVWRCCVCDEHHELHAVGGRRCWSGSKLGLGHLQLL